MTDANDPIIDFDQTNGLSGDTAGESNGTAAGDEQSAADRDAHVHPHALGATDAFLTDHYGEADDDA